ncbi:MAG: energy-coupling factor transporter ATPase [Clostridiales bacterium]|jgi:energy-coupling factor transport system ATP-binding protein|nr:energy-coupling factor transporter ATPase [Clostridiales bacterium]
MPIVTEQLSYVYSPKSPFAKQALNGVTLTVADGDFLGVIGHTGSGKSTLAGHFNALIRVQSGRVEVDGIDLRPKKLDFKLLRSTVGMVFQYPEYQLFDESVERDVGFGPRNLKIPPDEIAERVRESLEMVGLDYEGVRRRSPFELSGGQKRRVALAGVLAMRPKILVLDEPTAGLDPRGKAEILELIRRVKKYMCPTVIMISHNMDEIAANCNKIAVMSGGSLVCVLPPEELFTRGDLLKEHGIEMPAVTRIANALADRGLDIPRSLVREDDLVAAIVAAKRGAIKAATPAKPERAQKAENNIPHTDAVKDAAKKGGDECVTFR